MKINDGRITILIGDESTTIELTDMNSNTVFARIKLTPNQLSQALSRRGMTECEIVLTSIERLGKKMEHKKHEFEIPSAIPYGERSEVLSNVIKDTLPEGWVSDNSFASQDTFFTKDGKNYARTTIRRWI